MDYYIHGGLTKTGSTSIQSFLAHNLTELARQGVYYPVGYLDIHNRQHSPLSGALRAGRIDEAATFARQSREAAAAAGAGKVVWSGESIGMLRPGDMPKLIEVAREHGGAQTIRVIIYFRNLYDRLASRMNQQTKMRAEVVDDDFIDKLSRANPSQQISAWEEALGADNVDVRIFDNAVRAGLEQDFVQAIGAQWSSAFERLPPVNSSLDPITAQMLNLLRVEWGLPGGLVRNCERRSNNYKLPVLRAHAMELMHETVAATDLSHPKLAPYKDVLTRFKAPDPASAPPLPAFIEDLVGTLTYIKGAVEKSQSGGGGRKKKGSAAKEG